MGQAGRPTSRTRTREGLTNPTGSVLVSTDSGITKYNIVVEFKKEKGFTND